MICVAFAAFQPKLARNQNKRIKMFFLNKNKGVSRIFFVGLSMSTNLGKLVDILSFVDILSASPVFLFLPKTVSGNVDDTLNGSEAILLFDKSFVR